MKNKLFSVSHILFSALSLGLSIFEFGISFTTKGNIIRIDGSDISVSSTYIKYLPLSLIIVFVSLIWLIVSCIIRKKFDKIEAISIASAFVSLVLILLPLFL